MLKKYRLSVILAAIIAWLLGLPAGFLMIYVIYGNYLAIPGILLFLALAVIAACVTVGYVCHRTKREYRSVSVPDVKNAEDYPELAPFFEMMNAQQREIEHQLARVAKEKNRLSTIINNMDEGLIILDNDLKIIMLNESAYSWLGSDIARNECAGRHISEVCAIPEICDCIEKADHVNLTIDGRHLQLHVNHVVSSAEQVGRIGLLLDVTERNQIDRIKQEFTANVSHELKTPLTSISGYAELIESGMAQGDDALNFAGRIRRESVRMLALISDIIKLSKLDESTGRESFEGVDLLRVCEECRDVLEMSAEKHGVTVNITGESCTVPGIYSELTELVYNLIDNGIRYNRRGGSVDVDIRLGVGDSFFAVLTVTDTGIGIEKEHQPRVFERFYRVDKSRSKETGGTGLGLAIVKHVAERHNAKITMDSRVGEGSAIRVEFLRHQ